MFVLMNNVARLAVIDPVISDDAEIPDDDLMFISQNGIMIRVAAKGISKMGRNTQGVRIMRIGDGDKVVAAAKIANEEVKEEPAETAAETEPEPAVDKTEEELIAEQIKKEDIVNGNEEENSEEEEQTSEK